MGVTCSDWPPWAGPACRLLHKADPGHMLHIEHGASLGPTLHMGHGTDPGHALHMVPVSDWPCMLDSGSVWMRYTDWPCMLGSVHRTSLLQVPHIAYALHWHSSYVQHVVHVLPVRPGPAHAACSVWGTLLTGACTEPALHDGSGT